MIVIGNGQSRLQIDLNRIYEEKIGCNAVFRDTYTDFLVCCDKRMVKQAIAHGHPNIYTRQRWFDDFNHESVNPLPNLPYSGSDRKDDAFHWGSGPYAVLLGCSMSNHIKMVGFDLYGINGLINNVYSSTDGYNNKSSSAVDYSYWIYQIAKLFQIYNNTTFRIYNTSNWELPKQWEFDNVSLDNLNNL